MWHVSCWSYLLSAVLKWNIPVVPNGATPKNFFLVDEHLVNVKPALQKIMTETKWEEGDVMSKLPHISSFWARYKNPSNGDPQSIFENTQTQLAMQIQTHTGFHMITHGRTHTTAITKLMQITCLRPVDKIRFPWQRQLLPGSHWLASGLCRLDDVSSPYLPYCDS